MGQRDPIACEQCGAPFIPKSEVNHFCSRDCYLSAQQEQNLGKRQLMNVPAMTFTEIGAELGISRSRCQQLLESGLKKLREIVDPEDWL